MHHILGPAPSTAQGPSHHPGPQYTHLTSPSGPQGATAWSRFVDTHSGYNSSVGHQDVVSNSSKEAHGLQDFYRNYGAPSADCHVRRTVSGQTGPTFMDPTDTGYCTKALASSSLLANMQGCTVFGHEAMFNPNDGLSARSGQLDGQASCAYGSAHASIGHPFLPPR